jgi:periplasmic copper chaperone A
MKSLWPVAALMLALAITHPAFALRVENAWVMTPPAGARDAAAFVNVNDAAGDRLVRVSCACAARAELHEMSMSGATMTMRPLPDGIVVPGGGLRMGPHGVHVMLLGLSEALTEGDDVQLRLEFETAGTVAVSAVVRRR